MATSFEVNIADLEFILKQIRIAEDTSVGYTTAPKTILQSIMDAYGVTAVNAAQMPAGLRTVDGTGNGLLPGANEFGAADNLFPRLTDPVFLNDGDGTRSILMARAPGHRSRRVITEFWRMPAPHQAYSLASERSSTPTRASFPT